MAGIDGIGGSISNASNFSVTNNITLTPPASSKACAQTSEISSTAQPADNKMSGRDMWKSIGDMLFPKKEAVQKSPIEQFTEKLMDKIAGSFIGKLFGGNKAADASSSGSDQLHDMRGSHQTKSGSFMDKLMEKISQTFLGRLFGN